MTAQAKCLFCNEVITAIHMPSLRQSVCARCLVQSVRYRHKSLLFGLRSQANRLRLNLKDLLMAVQGKEYQCVSCRQQFIFEPEKEEFLSLQEFQDAAQCPACRDAESNKRGSGRDTGQSQILYGKCMKCGSNTEYFPLPNKEHTFYCSECAKGYVSSSY